MLKDYKTPKDVRLRDPDDYPALRNDIYLSAELFKDVFPMSYGGVTMNVTDVDYADPDNYDFSHQRKLILNNDSMYRRLRGTVTLTDDATGEVIDSKKMTLANVPVLSDLGVFIDNGSQYTILNQSRLRSGLYLRRRNDGDLECRFVFDVGTGIGTQFQTSMDLKTGIYYLEKGNSRIRLYSLLKDMGVDDEEMKKRWGDEIFLKNLHYDKQLTTKLCKQFVKTAIPSELDTAFKLQLLKSLLENLTVDKDVIKTTLPNVFDYSKRASQTFLKNDPGDVWVKLMKKAALKLLSSDYGACVLFDCRKGYYLLQEEEIKGRTILRPAGGHYEKDDETLRETILREIQEEFGLKRDQILPFIRLRGYIKNGRFKDCLVFVMWNHGLEEGTYQLSNSKDEIIHLTKLRLDDPRYVGPNLSSDLRPKQEGDR